MSFTVCSTVRPTITSPKSISGSLNRTYGYLPTAVTEQLYDSVGSAWPDWSVRAQIALTTLTVASAGVNSACTRPVSPGSSDPSPGVNTKGRSTAHLYDTATSPSLTNVKSFCISSFTAP